MKSLAYIVPLGLFLAVMAAFAIGLGHDPSKLPSTLIGKPLPQFALAPVRPNDGGLATADLKGSPRLLNVFASWCVSCRLEHPVLLALKSEGIPIDGLDWMDDASAGARYLAQNGDPYRRVGNDKSGRTGIDLGVAGVPETFVVDGQGRVRYKQIGPISPDDWTRKIEPLMAQLRTES